MHFSLYFIHIFASTLSTDSSFQQCRAIIFSLFCYLNMIFWGLTTLQKAIGSLQQTSETEVLDSKPSHSCSKRSVSKCLYKDETQTMINNHQCVVPIWSPCRCWLSFIVKKPTLLPKWCICGHEWSTSEKTVKDEP